MRFIYILLVVFAAMFFLYLAGVRNGRQKCIAEFEKSTTVVQTHVLNKLEEINEEVYTNTTGDIRHWLRERYTISE